MRALALLSLLRAAELPYPPEMGVPWVLVRSWPVYPPWSRLLWSPIAKSRAPTGFRDGSGITMIGAIAVASEWDGLVLSSPLSEPSYWAASLPPDR
jgi:hypothetical protein